MVRMPARRYRFKRTRESRPDPGARPGLRARIASNRSERQEKPRQLPRGVAIPSFFTLLNLFAGFLALIQISEGRLVNAAWLIVLAGFFDALDGMLARLTGSTSQFGIELDSLADVVSFGVAPSFVVYHHGLNEFGSLGLMVASLPALCGAVRLARFNAFAEEEKRDHFNGLPIPAQAATLVSFILVFDRPEVFESFERGHLTFLIPLVIGLSTLMVTNIRFDAIPQPTRAYIRSHRFETVSFALFLLLVALFQEAGLFAGFMGYMMIGIGRAIFRTGRNLLHDNGVELSD